MITYSKIGHFGRLGNQLFQFAGTVGIARKLGYNVAFPTENTVTPVTEHFSDGKVLDIVFDVPKAFKLSADILLPKAQINTNGVCGERFFHFDEKLLHNCPDNVNLSGYFQSDKYFTHIEQELRSLLTFNNTVQLAANTLFPKSQYQTVSIHIRRGDYVNQEQYHPVCSPEYYTEALSQFTDKNYNFIVFSDDMEYCKEVFGESENLLYIDNRDPYIDLCLMSMCDHNIIANSSFSWWGAWLNNNKDKKVIAPKQWFGPAYSHYITEDLYCKGWIIK